MLFVRGVERFAPAEHRPHPPGYPLLIGLGKALALAVGDPFRSLVILSVVSSAVGYVALALAFRELAIRCGAAAVADAVGVTGALLFHFSPAMLVYGPLALSGAIASGNAILAAQAAGADLAYIGSAFIATAEANADERYKQMIVDSSAADIVYSNLFTGVHGNYLRQSIVNAGLDPEALPQSDPSKMNFGSGGGPRPRARPAKDIDPLQSSVKAQRRLVSSSYSLMYGRSVRPSTRQSSRRGSSPGV